MYVKEKKYVYFAVRTEPFNIIQINLSLLAYIMLCKNKGMISMITSLLLYGFK
jgi:hypothetical protein